MLTLNSAHQHPQPTHSPPSPSFQPTPSHKAHQPTHQHVSMGISLSCSLGIAALGSQQSSVPSSLTVAMIYLQGNQQLSSESTDTTTIVNICVPLPAPQYHQTPSHRSSSLSLWQSVSCPFEAPRQPHRHSLPLVPYPHHSQFQ
jgi:hypothetical protein